MKAQIECPACGENDWAYRMLNVSDECVRAGWFGTADFVCLNCSSALSEQEFTNRVTSRLSEAACPAT